MKSFDGLALDVVKCLHAFFVARERVDVGEPGGVPFLDGGLKFKGGLGTMSLYLLLALHSITKRTKDVLGFRAGTASLKPPPDIRTKSLAQLST